MTSKITLNKNNLNEGNKFQNILDCEEYYLIKEKVGYKFIISKRSNDIIIKCKNYEYILNNNDFSILTKPILKTIDDAFLFITNLFEENKVIIKDININKTITLLLNLYIDNKQKDIEITLLYNNTNKDLIINNYNKLKKEINYLNNEINKLKKEINQLKRNKINNNMQITNNKSNEINNNKIKELNENINNKDNNNEYNNNEYINKINYKFKKEPNLKYKLDIINTYFNYRWNDIFEIFLSYKDNKEYFIFPNKNNYNLDIFTLLNNKIILSLKGDKNIIGTIRYFINKKNYNEYLISVDNNKIVIIWDIINNYNIKYQIDTKYESFIYSYLKSLKFGRYKNLYKNELKNYICNIHNKSYNLYCHQCKRDLCLISENEHKKNKI